MAGGGSDEFCRGWQLLAELENARRSIFARRIANLRLAECLSSLVEIQAALPSARIQPRL